MKTIGSSGRKRNFYTLPRRSIYGSVLAGTRYRARILIAARKNLTLAVKACPLGQSSLAFPPV